MLDLSASANGSQMTSDLRRVVDAAGGIRPAPNGPPCWNAEPALATLLDRHRSSPAEPKLTLLDLRRPRAAPVAGGGKK